MTAPAFRPKVFVSYSHKDRELKEKFDTNLTVLREQGEIEFWTDGEILPGDHWDDEITDAMNNAHLIIFLVSNNFLASSFIRRKEAPMAMVRVNQGKAVIVPVILGKTPGWQNEDWNTLQALPSKVKPVDHPDWITPENAFADVEEKLRELIALLPDKLAKQARQWKAATQGPASGEEPEPTPQPPLPRVPTARQRWLPWAFAAVLLVAGAGITGAILKRPAQPQPNKDFAADPTKTAALDPALTAWLNAPKVDRTVVEIFAAKGNGYVQNGLQPLISGHEKVAARRLHEMYWGEPNKMSRASNGLTWELFVKGVAKPVTELVYVTTYFAAERAGSSGTDPQRIKIDPNDASLACLPDSPDTPPGFTHMGTVANHMIDVWGEPAISPQLFAGRHGEIPAGPQRVAIEVKIENRPVYRAVFDLDVPPRVYAQPRSEWLAAVKEPKVTVSLPEPSCAWPAKDRLDLRVKLAGDTTRLAEPLAFQTYFAAEEAPSSRDSAWTVDPLVNGGIGTSIEIEGFNRTEFCWTALLSTLKEGPLITTVPLHAGPRGHFTPGKQGVGLEVLSRGEPVWRGLVKLEAPAEPWSYPDGKNKLLITDTNDADIRSHLLQAKRAAPYAADPRLVTGLTLDNFRFHNLGEPLKGPFVIQFYIKAGRAPGTLPNFASMTAEPFPGISIWDTPDTGGFTARAAASIDLVNQTGDKNRYDSSSLTFYIGHDKAAIPAGLHEIGIELIDGSNASIYHGIVQVNVP